MLEDIDFKRQDEESEEEYQYRVCGLKEEKGLRWDDICAILNAELGYNYTESRYRKQYAAYLAGYRARDKEACQEAPPQTEIPLNDAEEAMKAAYGFNAGQIPYYRLLRQEGRFERFYSLVGGKLSKMEPPQIQYTYKKEGNPVETEKRYFLTIADTHIGANFVSVNNNYSIAEAQRRFNVLLEETVKFVKEKKLQTLSVLSLGDIVQGCLRLQDLKINEMAVVDAFVRACRMYAEFLNALSAFCQINFYQVCYSNHDQLRPLGTKASELASEDMGKIFLAYLTDVLADNERVIVVGESDRDYLEFNIFDFECFALHGHQVKSVADLYKNLATRHHKFYDYIFVGHTHSTKEFVNAEGKRHELETLVSPSFIGSDPYADKLMVGSKAGCKIYEFDKLRGHTASYKIILN